MVEFFINLPFIYQALLAGLFTWSVTAIGASSVFLFKKQNENVLNIMLSFAAGVMIAASFFSLLQPAIQLSEELFNTDFVIPTIGFLFGMLFIVVADRGLHRFFENDLNVESKKRTALLVGSITLHNIPEGMCVGVAFASASMGLPGVTIISALLLTLAIGLQNFPEGVAVSLPLRNENMSRKKAFFLGQFSGMVEPVACVLSAIFVIYVRTTLHFLLAFSAGAMIGVVVSELIPEAHKNNKTLSTIGLTIGFCIMMALDVALG
jgi:ZIP family zinc transporter